ncbi:hypothetical protein A2U01_0056797 [Trifolium medium]|uniref:Uncharacterized protein n=1 Tax=Trifolium medium TaxID=97028 RepID=A0A392RID3_9FABA|nr:hypothetical protein [Trifolium medium]
MFKHIQPMQYSLKGLIFSKGAQYPNEKYAQFIFTEALFTLMDLSIGVSWQVSTYSLHRLRCIILLQERNPEENGWETGADRGI